MVHLFAALLPSLVAGIVLVAQPSTVASRLLRALAVISTLAVALFVLLPSSVAAVGLPALVVAAVAAITPAAIERVFLGDWRPSHTALAQAVAAHQFVDGIQMGALAASLPWTTWMFVGLHGLPLVAMAVATAKREHGRAHAAKLWLGLLFATGLGWWTSTQPGAQQVAAEFEAWLKAIVAGLVLHVIAHHGWSFKAAT